MDRRNAASSHHATTRDTTGVLGDDLMLGFLALLVAVAVAIGAGTAQAGTALWAGLPLLAAGAGIWVLARGRLVAHLCYAGLAMALVALHIQVGAGDNLYHFGAFVVLAILLVYRDWRVVVTGAAVVAVHHALFNLLQEAGWGAVCFTRPGWDQVVVHALYVVVQTGIEIWIALLLAKEARQAGEMRALVDRLVTKEGAIDLDARDLAVTTRLARTLAQALSLMHGAVGQVGGAASQVRTAAAEIARGNADLSSRSEEQASSLEQTASSLEELAAASKKNADSARQANELSIGASDVALKGGRVMQDMIQTMSGIADASRKIADITAVIDAIAFQTNILALNAAVEAARAGEQGRGFAVVASEVRSLAQRSATAAKEIKSLIEESAGRVESGARLVDGAGKTMEEIVDAVKRVTDFMSEISAASREQLQGIEEVSGAVAQMDGVVQGNAARVEQSAAAAENLARQAEDLVQAMARFNSGESAATAAATEAHAASLPRSTVQRLPRAPDRGALRRPAHAGLLPGKRERA